MHCVIAITRKLVSLLGRESIACPKLSEIWERVLAKRCEIELGPPQTKSGDKQTFSKRWEDAPLSRSQALAILRERARLLDPLAKLRPEQAERNDRVRDLWQGFVELATLMMQADVRIEEQTWLRAAREWGQKFVRTYGREDVTPYIHVFVYHVGFYLARYRGIEKFATYALEGKHAENKDILAKASNKARHGIVEAARQQLEMNVRLEVHHLRDRESCKGRGEDPAKEMWNASRKSKRRAHPEWSEASLDLEPRFRQFVRSSTHIS